MKTAKTIIVTVLATIMATIMVGTIGVVTFLFNEGNLKVNKMEQEHNRVVMVDGEVIESKTWLELNGYGIHLDLNDGFVIEK